MSFICLFELRLSYTSIMKCLNYAVLFMSLSFSHSTLATEDVLSLHLSCESKEGCVTLEKNDGNVAIVMADSVLVLDANSVQSAYITPDSNLSIQLSEAASLTLAKITVENAGRKLAIVLHGRAIANPTITSPIYSGRIEVIADRPTQPPYWESVPWLLAKLYPDGDAPQPPTNIKRIIRLSFAALPLIILTGVGMLLIRRRLRRKTPT